jgi:molybdate-binding protein/DNA-binding transcriptional regulator YhcF (GntR family)
MLVSLFILLHYKRELPMDGESYLYKKIADDIRNRIISGKLKPGDRLPSVRSMTKEWNCTVGTVQHAYHMLSEMGLTISQSGRGTHIANSQLLEKDLPKRRASLVRRSEDFISESMTAGYTISEIEQTLQVAIDHLRIVNQINTKQYANEIICTGSHDLALAWIASHFGEIVNGYSMSTNFTGSLGGLIALAEGNAHVAGSHLWDKDTDTFNNAFVERFFPGKHMALITLAFRQIGLILPDGNPNQLSGIADLTKNGVDFINRQPGSGTRVWFDNYLSENNIDSNLINGYTHIGYTHSDIGHAIASGSANAGIGLQASAMQFGLDFIPLRQERFDLVTYQEYLDKPAFKTLIAWLKTPIARQLIESLGGYDTHQSGEVIIV